MKRDDLPTFAIEYPAGWALLNPLVPIEPVIAAGSQVIPLEDGTIFVATQSFTLALPGQGASDLDLVSDLLKRLRYATGQAMLPQEIIVLTYETLEVVPPPVHPEAEWRGRVILREFLRKTAITADAVKEAGSQATAGVVPVYSGMLLDAIQAAEEGDYKRAILYAAVAVEAMAANFLDEYYQHFLSATPAPAHLRIVEQVLPGNTVARKDPVFYALRETSRRSFRYLLHEIPLYLLQRSLLAEDPPLYEQAIILHNTRNDLAHTGSLSDLSGRMSLDRAGAVRAIEAARKVFSWFGAPGKYMPPYYIGEDRASRAS